ncbi:MAG: hypothetical protein ACAF41_02500 [Leptolyngbya sp. BL-A-14]
MFLLSGLKNLFSLTSTDPDVILDNLESDSDIIRGIASGTLWILESREGIPSRTVPRIVRALHREEESLKIVFDLFKVLYHLDTNEALKGLNQYLKRMARYLVESDEEVHKGEGRVLQLIAQDVSAIHSVHANRTWATFFFDDGRELIKPDLESFHAVRIALFHVVINPESSWNYKIRSFRALETIDPSLLDLLSPDVRQKYKMGVQVSDAIANSAKGILKASVQTSTNAFLRSLFPNFESRFLLDALFKNINKNSSHQEDEQYDVSSYDTIQLPDGTKLGLPELSQISDKELLNFLKQLVYALT